MFPGEIRKLLAKERSRQNPPIAAYVMAVFDMGLFEEVGEDVALLDVQWALFEKVFGLHFDCSMLMAKCGCVCVLEGWEFNDRLQEYVYVKRFTGNDIHVQCELRPTF